ncbi:hypothetical protein [Pseudomonas denitrificans (nom. rej.)]|uniref:Uncharacterized protein n=1 Tax=Pseudomonas denitrificans TaxID=43306 RepID=A0A9X7R626_PSEDE|nr:hypothetical protein [Pseudomonas denitrificans (nom. rej.)]QEY74108.1 hypothetical protein F1C79_22255 [Pseudomonas denitrificans (nom. rej.)]
MNDTELFAHYEKVYYHELGRKEQIFSRLNVPLAVMVAVVGFYAVLIGGGYKELELGVRIWFWVTFAMSGLALGVGAGFFVDALLGRMDSALADPNTLETWRQSLRVYYSDQQDCDAIVAAEVRRAVYADFMNCSSLITVNNDRKASSLYYCNVLLIAAVLFAAISYAIEKVPSL